MDAYTNQLISHCFKQKGGVKEAALQELFGDIFGGNMSEFCDALKVFFTKKEEPEKKVVEAEKKGDDKEPETKPKKGGRKPKAEKAKKGDDEEPKSEAEKAAVEEVKHMTRMTKDTAEKLKEALTNAGISCDDEKAFEHAKKEFRNYVNSLTADDYKKSSLTEHMCDFAGIKNWIEDKPKKGKAKKAEAEAKPEKKGKAKKAKSEKPEPEKKGDDKEPEAASGGGAANVKVTTLTLTELMERSERLVGTPNLGEYFDPKTGETVMGPEEDADEDMEEVKFEDKTYAVGEKTGRVYAQDDEGLDIFVGFKGAGKFKDME